MNRVVSVLKHGLVVVVFIFSVLIVLSRFDTPLSVRMFAITSGSMAPAIPAGSIVVVKPQQTYAKGDIISFSTKKGEFDTVTHRIVQVLEGEIEGVILFRTKGDASEDPDRNLTSQKSVVGKVVFSVPFTGYVVSFAQTQLGFVVLIIIPATILIYSEAMNVKDEIANMFRKEKDIDKKNP